MTGSLLALALAAAEILVPPWPLAPDGDLVGVRGAGALSADGAGVEAAGAGLFRVIPSPGAGRVVLRAGGAQVVAPVEAPLGLVVVSVHPHAAVKGRDTAVDVALEVRRATGELDGEATPPEIVVSSGRIRDLVPAGPGRFRAVYEPSATRYPEVAVLLALVPRCPLCPTPRAIGHAILPLAAAVTLPGESEPGVRSTVTIAGASYGPVVADAKGRFSVPVVIPPAARFASASSIDELGNRQVKELDLHLPEVDRLACAAWPRAIPADGRSEASIWCVASTSAGAPAEGAPLVLSSVLGEAGPLTPERGALQRARYRAPSGGGGQVAVVRATYPEGGVASKDEIRIVLTPGAPAEIAATVAREPVPLGATVSAETAVRDRHGDLLGRASSPPGAPEGFVAPDRFVARKSGRSQRALLSFALPPGHEAAFLSLRRDGESWLAQARAVDGRPAMGIPLRFGSGAVVTTDARGEARAAGTDAHETVVAPGGARAAGWAGIVPAEMPFEISRTVEVALRPGSAVDVTARVEAGVLRWRVDDAEGRPLAGRTVSLRTDGVELGPAERDGDGGRAAIRGGGGVVAVMDVETGVAAVVEVR